METQDDKGVEEVARMDSVTNAQGDGQISVGQAGAVAGPSQNDLNVVPDEINQALTMETQDDKGVEEVARMDSVTNAQGDGQISVGQAGAVAGPSQNDLNVVPDEINQVPELANKLQHLSPEDVPSGNLPKALTFSPKVNRLDAVTKTGLTPVKAACRHGHLDLVKDLLPKGANVQEDTKEECLHLAVLGGHLHVVEYIVDTFPDLDINKPGFHATTGNTGFTPVKVASFHGHLDLVKYLVQKGANVQEDTKEGCLHLAAWGGHLHVVEYIVDTFPDLDINKPGFHALTPFMIACKYAFIDIFTFLLEKGVDVTCHDKFNLSCLHNACRGGSLEIVKTLINLGTFDIDEEDVNGMTPLGHAVKFDKFEVMEYLIQEGADINAGHQSRTPIMFAFIKRNASFVDFLISNGCNLSTVGQRGQRSTLLHFACDKKGMGTEIPEMLIKYGIHVDAPDSNNTTPVMCAARNGNRDVVECLIRHGADLRLSDKQGRNCMYHAEKAGQTRMFEYLRRIMY